MRLAGFELKPTPVPVEPVGQDPMYSVALMLTAGIFDPLGGEIVIVPG